MRTLSACLLLLATLHVAAVQAQVTTDSSPTGRPGDGSLRPLPDPARDTLPGTPRLPGDPPQLPATPALDSERAVEPGPSPRPDTTVSPQKPAFRLPGESDLPRDSAEPTQ